MLPSLAIASSKLEHEMAMRRNTNNNRKPPAYRPTLPTCPPAYLPTYLPAYPPTCLPACLPPHLPTYLPTYLAYRPPTLPTLPTYLPACLPTFLITYQPACPPTCLTTCASACLSFCLPACPPASLLAYTPAHKIPTNKFTNLLAQFDAHLKGARRNGRGASHRLPKATRRREQLGDRLLRCNKLVPVEIVLARQWKHDSAT